MKHRWGTSLRLILAFFVVFTAMPFGATAGEGTPAPVEQESPTTAPVESPEATIVETPAETMPEAEEPQTPDPTDGATETAATASPDPTTEVATEAATDTATLTPVTPETQLQTIGNPALTEADAEDQVFVDLFVEKIYCQDDARAGTTEFLLDMPPNVMFKMAAASTCYAESPFDERSGLTITLDQVDGEYSDRITLTRGGLWLDGIPTGTYVVTESGDDIAQVTSDPFELTEPGKRLRIINYYNEVPRPTPESEAVGSIYGFVLFCDDPDREGDVDFIIAAPMRAAAVTPCEVPFDPSGLLMLYPVDPDTIEIDETSGELIPISMLGSFQVHEIPSGYYALGYVAPDSGNMTISRPFVVDSQNVPFIEINIFSAIVATGFIDVFKDFCVDPARAGEVAFQVNTADDVPLPMITNQATASTECRFSNDGDGTFDFTLTNVDTGRTWTETLVGDDSITFAGVPAGTYTLTEAHKGNVHTSAPFSFKATLGNSSIYVRNFIAERDWEPDDINEEYANVFISGFVCVDMSRNGGAAYFHFGPVDGEMVPDLASGDVAALAAAASGSTAECREATADDNLQFSLVPTDGEGDPIPFFFNGGGSYYSDADSVPSGDYIITEATTGVSTGILRLSGDHYLEFLKYEPLPTAKVTVNISSADPVAADTLPADATWTVSQNGTELFTDTFAAEHLQLPVSIPVNNPIAYGTYDVAVSAGPAFEAYTQTFTVDEPTEILAIVLQPVAPEPTPEPTQVAPVETIDVIVTLTTADGGDLPTGTEVCLLGTEYDVCWALDAVAGRMIAAAAPSGTTVTFPTVPVGTYELSVPANAPYLAYSTTINVAEISPYEVMIVLQRQDVTPTEDPGTSTPTATVTPGTETPTATATATVPVKGLPSTGNGTGSGTLATVLLAGGSALAFMLALGFAWHQRRIERHDM